MERGDEKQVKFTVRDGRDGAFIAAFVEVGDARFFAQKFSELNKRTYVSVVSVYSGQQKGLFYEGRELFVKGF